MKKYKRLEEADRILQGLQGWGGDKMDGTALTKDSVNAGECKENNIFLFDLVFLLFVYSEVLYGTKVKSKQA